MYFKNTESLLISDLIAGFQFNFKVLKSCLKYTIYTNSIFDHASVDLILALDV